MTAPPSKSPLDLSVAEQAKLNLRGSPQWLRSWVLTTDGFPALQPRFDSSTGNYWIDLRNMDDQMLGDCVLHLYGTKSWMNGEMLYDFVDAIWEWLHGDRDAMLIHGIPEWPVPPEGGSG